MPLTLQYDGTFTHADTTAGAAGSTSAVTDTAAVGTAGAWTDVMGGVARVLSNDLYLSGASETDWVTRPAGESAGDQSVTIYPPVVSDYNPGNSWRWKVLLRFAAGATPADANAYLVSFGGAFMTLNRLNPGFSPIFLGFVAMPTLTANNPYKFTASIVGTTLTATISDVNGVEADTTASATDATLATGTPGLAGSNGSFSPVARVQLNTDAAGGGTGPTGGTFTYTDLAPHLYGRLALSGGAYGWHGRSTQLRVRVKGSAAVLSNTTGDPANLQVSVDGATPVTLTGPTLLTGASDGWHDLLVAVRPGLQDGFGLSATATVLTVTGADPQIAAWADAGPTDSLGAPSHGQSSFKPDAFADYGYNYTSPLSGRSGLHVAMFRFRAKTDRISVWTTGNPTVAWEIDGVRQGQAPLTGVGLNATDLGWRAVATGLDGGTEREYAIAVGDCVSDDAFDAVMLGPGATWGTVSPIGYYVQFGDSTTNATSCEPAAGIPRDRTDTSPCYAIARALNLFPWVAGYDGAAISPDRGFPYYPGSSTNGYQHAHANLPTTVTPAAAGIWLGRNDWGSGDPSADVQSGYVSLLSAVLADLPTIPVLCYYPPNLVSTDNALSAPINADIGLAVAAVGDARVHVVDLSQHAFNFTSGNDASVNQSCDATHYLPLGSTAISNVAIPLVQAALADPGPTPAAEAPTFTPAPGTYTSARSVTMASATPDPVIYYTADGTTPTTSSTLYTGAVTLSTTTTLKALTVAAGFDPSPVTTGVYTFEAAPATSSPPRARWFPGLTGGYRRSF